MSVRRRVIFGPRHLQCLRGGNDLLRGNWDQGARHRRWKGCYSIRCRKVGQRREKYCYSWQGIVVRMHQRLYYRLYYWRSRRRNKSWHLSEDRRWSVLLFGRCRFPTPPEFVFGAKEFPARNCYTGACRSASGVAEHGSFVVRRRFFFCFCFSLDTRC